jgi:cystathionine beta-lyase
MQPDKDVHVDTVVTHAGNHPADHFGFVNPPPYRGSTVVFPDVDSLGSGRSRYHYGRLSNPTSDALIEAVATLEGAVGARLCPSGLSACTTAILAVAGAGDHILVSDAVYGPTRQFCDTAARRFGIETSYYDPRLGAGIAALMRPATRAVFVESPASYTFEVQDLPAIAEVAHRHGALVICDNTWATPLLFKPLAAGADISVMAATKYLVGHSDALLGTISAGKRGWEAVRRFHAQAGLCVGPDDVSLALRGLRTLSVRLQRHQSAGFELARWLEGHDDVARVLHPGLPSHPDHAVWARDFSGASGLFSFITRPAPFEAVKALLDGLSCFALGYSWGGYESLAMTVNPATLRSATTWTEPGHLIRLHVGLEDPRDLIADLERGLARFCAAA